MSAFLVPRKTVLDWIAGLMAKGRAYFPQRTETASFEFAPIRANSEIGFESNPSLIPRKEFRASTNMVPPGKKLAPAQEELFRFRKNEKGDLELTPILSDQFQILAGVRPCDLRAINLMDRVNSEGIGDPNYLTRRMNTAIVAHDCLQPCDDNCFCDAAGSLRTREGADVFLTPLQDEILLECLTQRGRELVEDTQFTPCPDPASKKAEAETRRTKPFGRQFAAPVEDLPGILKAHWDSEVWDRHVERCFSCGTCNLVCPTCYCFDVQDDLNLEDISSGHRSRTWDGCMLPDFAEVAGGHNFRSEAAARQRHRVKRKFEYLPQHFAEGSFCVGCGRCGHQCTAGIDIFDIVNELVATAEVPR